MKNLLLAIALLTSTNTYAAYGDSPACIGWTGIYLRSSIYEMKCQTSGTIAPQALNMLQFNGCFISNQEMKNNLDAHMEEFLRARGNMTTADYCQTDAARHELGLK